MTTPKTIALGIALATLLQAAQGTSLYDPKTFQPQTSDLRPRRIGSLVTVLVYESASASSTANTSASRDAGIGLSVQTPSHDHQAGIDASNRMDGRGKTERQGKVLAQLTAVVTGVTAEGDLRIVGEQVLDINNERQQIRIEGTVRAQDVSDLNVVLSTRIANARISYSGQGDLADRQRPSWWQRFASLFGI